MARETLFAAVWRINKTFPVVIAALLAVNVLVACFLFLYWSPRVESLEREVMTRQARLRQIKAQHGVAASPEELFRLNREDLETFQQAIPEVTEFTQLIEELYTLSGDAGLTLASISYSPKVMPESSLLEYKLGFSVEGDYGQIKEFIFSLEQSPRIMAIESLGLHSAGDAVQQKVALSIRLVTYFRLEKA